MVIDLQQQNVFPLNGVAYSNTQGWRGWGVVAGAQGTTMSGYWQLLDELNHTGMRGIVRPCKYGTTCLKEDL